MGLPKKSWFVCLHVREQGYLGNTPRHHHRNSSVSNYLPAIRYITSKGGYVIRMGDPSMTSIQPMDKVIDYALSGFKSDLMDIYLLSQCYFFLGCDSGLFYVACMFHKPCCLVNLTELVISPPIFDQSMFIPKRFYSKQKQRFISLAEALNSDVALYNSDYIYVENSPEEILETVKEQLLFMKNGKFYDSHHLQNKFNSNKRKRHERLVKGNSIVQSQKDALSGTMPSQCRVGSFYLKQCWEYTSYLQKLTKLYNGEE
jgi:putative glycosyltransferase (TIGR04372 family)